MSDSIWRSIDTAEKSDYGKMECMEMTDVAIVGGGLCGILCAWFLKDAGVDCILLDKDRIAEGTGKDAMAQVTSQHGLIYSKLLERDGEEKARMYFQANEQAIQKYRELSEQIDCDFEETSSYVYSKNDREKIEKEIDAVDRIGGKADFCETTELPFDISGAVRFPGQAKLNPVKLLNGLVKELEKHQNIHIYEGVEIDDWFRHVIWCGIHVTVADHIICTTHIPFYEKLGKYSRKLYMEESCILALGNAQKMNGMYTDEAQGGLSFRSYGDLLLMTGGMYKPESDREAHEWEKLREAAAMYYPEAKEKASWKVQDCFSLDGIPYIGSYASERKTPGLYVATGFNGWGMTSAMTAAMLLTEIILKDKFVEAKEAVNYSWKEVFSTERKILLPQYFSNIKDTISDRFSFRPQKYKK